jgi:hypothetical protein
MSSRASSRWVAAPVPVPGFHLVLRDLPVPGIAGDLDVRVHRPLGELRIISRSTSGLADARVSPNCAPATG